MRLTQVVSGGQTGVDRAALDAAMAAGIPVGGWCPRGRRAEDGAIHARYPLRETRSDRYPARTAANVRDADATLVLAPGPLTGGTRLTVDEARRRGRPYRVVDLEAAGPPEVDAVRAWIEAGGHAVLNVAGPRESTCPGVGRVARAFLDALFAAWEGPGHEAQGRLDFDPHQPEACGPRADSEGEA